MLQTFIRSLNLGAVDVVVAELVAVEDTIGNRQDGVRNDAGNRGIAAESGNDKNFFTDTAGAGPYAFGDDQYVLHREHECSVITSAAAERVLGVRKRERVRLHLQPLA